MTTPDRGTHGPAQPPRQVLIAAVLTAAPVLVAHSLALSATLLNQVLALAAWGAWVLALAPGRLSKVTAPLQGALAAMAIGVLLSWGPGFLPASLALSAGGVLVAAMVLAWAGGEAARQDDGPAVFAALAWGVLIAGVLSAVVALMQVFAPDQSIGGLVSRSRLAGRAVGNLRQPNHLCSLLLWGVIAAVALHDLRRLPLRWTVAATGLLVFAIELSASRTGALGLLLLALWGALGGGLSSPMRRLLLAAPLLYAASYGAMLAWGEWTQQTVGASARLTSDVMNIESPNSRRRIWANALAMIAAEPWTGVGFGEFNLAWTLTHFDDRPTAFFDHTHNLPLQLVVELGLPLGGLVTGLLVVALVTAVRRAGRALGDRRVAAIAAVMLVLMIGLHSLVEYPLWYAYFLLPAAFAGGFALGSGDELALPRRESLAGAMAGAALVIAASAAVLDYQRVAPVYGTQAREIPLVERVKRGQLSVLFDHYADFAAATVPDLELDTTSAFERTAHNVLDPQLMIAWARHLASSGQVDLARTLAQRVREFGGPGAVAFFAPCRAPGPNDFQCQPPERAHGWREFLSR